MGENTSGLDVSDLIVYSIWKDYFDYRREHKVAKRAEKAKQRRADQEWRRENHRVYKRGEFPWLKGHSIIFWWLFGWAVFYIPAIYFSYSDKHYWHW